MTLRQFAADTGKCPAGEKPHSMPAETSVANKNAGEKGLCWTGTTGWIKLISVAKRQEMSGMEEISRSQSYQQEISLDHRAEEHFILLKKKNK